MRYTQIALIAVGLTSHAFAGTVFQDDFESPIVGSSYIVDNTSQKIDTSLWVRTSNRAFASGRNGIVSQLNDKEEAFNMPSGNQAWTHRYSSNGGLTSAYGAIDSLARGQKIKVTFDAVADPTLSGIKGTNYTATIVLFDGAGRRSVLDKPETNTSAVLAQITGPAPSTWTKYELSYKVGDPVIDNDVDIEGLNTDWSNRLLGHDIAIRFGDGSDAALIDNVKVDISNVDDTIPETSSFALVFGALALSSTMLGRRCKKQ